MNTVHVQRSAWCLGEPQNDGRPRVYLGCFVCHAPMTLTGLLTADGLSLKPEMCLPGCGAEFGVLLMGWRERNTIRVGTGLTFPNGTHPASLCQADGPVDQPDGFA